MKGRRLQPEKLAAMLAGQSSLLLAFDYDGTLAEFAPTPPQARLPSFTKRSLRSVARKPGWHVAILSGRRLADVRSLVRIPGLSYGGNHGIELSLEGKSWVHPEADRLRPAFRRCAADVRARLDRFPGTFLESKGLGLSVHYRNMRQSLRAELDATLGPCLRPGLRLLPANKIWEVRPALRWDKGHALLRIARGLGSRRLVFMGDDVTDEEAFRTLGARALTVRVGLSGKTAAAFRLADVQAVNRFLETLAGPTAAAS